jgi:hypothetical protein
MYIVRTLVQAQREVPVSNQDNVLGEGTTVDRYEPVKWAAPVDG